MPILEGKDISKHFGGLAAVSHVDFHVDKGEIVGLIGPNGAGKTTLFNLISGALVPDSGVIKFNDKTISTMKPYRICRQGVARTFQSVKVFGNMTVMENVITGALFGASGRVPPAGASGEAARLLEFVGLSGMSHVPAKDLTVSRQKRLEVARALATKPELLLLDELMAGLNATEVIQDMELVKEIRKSGVTVLMIEHVMKAIMSVCDRIIVLHHGEKVAEGKPQEIAANKTVVEVYLGE